MATIATDLHTRYIAELLITLMLCDIATEYHIAESATAVGVWELQGATWVLPVCFQPVYHFSYYTEGFVQHAPLEEAGAATRPGGMDRPVPW